MQNSSHSSPNPAASFEGLLPSEATFANLLGTARRRWPWILLALVISWGLAGAYYAIAPPKFESTAEVLVMQKDTSLATTTGTGSTGGEPRVSEDVLATHIELVQSKRIVGQALSDNGLEQLPSILDNLDEDQTPTDYVIENLYVSRAGTGQSKTAHVLRIGFRHTSDADAQAVVTAIVKGYQRFLGDKFQDVNKEAADLIASAQKDLGEDLEKAEKQYTEFRQRAPLLWNGTESSNIHRDRYEQINTELGLLQLQETDSKTRLKVVEEGLEQFRTEKVSDIELLALIDEKNAARLGILAEVDRGGAETAEFQSLQPARLQTARAEYDSLITMQLRLGTLMQDYGPLHPEVVATRQMIETLKEILEKKSTELGIKFEERALTPRMLIDAYVRLLKQDLITLGRRQTELQQLADIQAKSAKSLVSFELEGESLRKAAMRKQDLYDAVVDRLREINLAKDYGGFINEVIAEPELGEKVSPKLAFLAIFGTVGGLLLAVGFVGLAEFADRSFRSSDEIQQSLELPVLTHLPNLTLDPGKKVAASIAASGSHLDSTLRTFHRPKSREAEVFRGLRTSLFFRSEGRKVQLIQCTSPNQGDGKSTLAGNLAISIAQTGRKVLLIDCDMRRPRLHDMFGLSNTVGVADIIMGDAEPADAIQSTETDNLSALPCGTIPDNPAELLTSPDFENFLNLMREKFEYIVLDCPPVLAVADPCIIAPRVDGVVLAIRVSKDSRPQALRAKQILAEIEAPLLGVVVNCCDSGIQYGQYGYGSRFGFGNSYGYGYGMNDDGANKYYEETEGNSRRPRKVQRV